MVPLAGPGNGSRCCPSAPNRVQTTGTFSSTDPVYGGNLTSYAYPSDPVNGSDTTGLWCIAGVGTTCTRHLRNENKTSIPVTHKIRKKLKGKHLISWRTAKWLMPRLRFSHTEYKDRNPAGFDDIVYRRKIFEYVCTSGRTNCKKTGASVVVRAIVNFGRGKNKKTIGLRSMYCEGPGECPPWLNHPKR